MRGSYKYEPAFHRWFFNGTTVVHGANQMRTAIPNSSIMFAALCGIFESESALSIAVLRLGGTSTKMYCQKSVWQSINTVFWQLLIKSNVFVSSLAHQSIIGLEYSLKSVKMSLSLGSYNIQLILYLVHLMDHYIVGLCPRKIRTQFLPLTFSYR